MAIKMKNEEDIEMLAKQLLHLMGAEKVMDVADSGSDSMNLFFALRTFCDNREGE